MKRLLMLLAAFIVACGSDPVAPPAPTPVGVEYVLTNLRYEDVVPGEYSVTITDSTLQGGPAVLTFDSTGNGSLVNESALTAQAWLLPDSVYQPYAVLSAGQGTFTFVQDSAGAVTFSPSSPWPLAPGGVLSDSAFVYSARQCFNEDCTDYTFFTHRWVRR